MGPSLQRVVALVVLLAAGILSLPLAAYFLDSESADNFILPAQVAGMVVLGALVGSLLPGLAGAGASQRRAAIVGALVGVAMSVVSVMLFFLLISGFDGA